MLRRSILFLLFLLLSNYLKSQEKEFPITFEISETDDVTSVVSGGIKSGDVVSMGMFNLNVNFETEKARLWKDGTFTVHLLNTHGATPSADYAGDLQVYSNIEAGKHTGLFELYYSQTIRNFEIKGGWGDLCNNFYCTQFGGLFLNSSFGISPGAALNVPVSIYPVTAPFVYASYSFNSKSKLQFAVFEGNPGDIETNKYNLNWDLSRENGMMNILEYQYIREEEKYFGLKTGIYIHTEDVKGLEDTLEVFDNTFGFYGVLDKNLVPAKTGCSKGLDAFLQYDFAPADRSGVNYYIGTGLSYRGFFAKEKIRDEFGFAIAHLKMSQYWKVANPERKSRETSLEFTYKVTLFDHVSLQPDFQYIINPDAGENGILKNAAVVSLRLNVCY
jgi:porin